MSPNGDPDATEGEATAVRLLESVEAVAWMALLQGAHVAHDVRAGIRA